MAQANDPAGRILHVSQGASGGNGSESAPYGSIQDAVDAAGPGDTILVGEGTYHENIVIRDSGTASDPIRLVAADGPGSVDIHPDDPTKDTIRIAAADNIVIEGFTLHGSDDDTRQVVHIHGVNNGADPASNITIVNNVIHRGEGDGVKASKAEDINVIGNTILGGGNGESGIDFMGVTGGRIEGNEIRDIPGIAVMIKGGSSGIDILDNDIIGTGKNGVEIGGYSQMHHYSDDFIDAGHTYEAYDITFSGNLIDGAGNTGIRIIGAQSVKITDNIVLNVPKVVTIDDSDKFHEPWLADDIYFAGNDFGLGEWLTDRSASADIEIVDDAKVDTAALEDLFCIKPVSNIFTKPMLVLDSSMAIDGIGSSTMPEPEVQAASPMLGLGAMGLTSGMTSEATGGAMGGTTGAATGGSAGGAIPPMLSGGAGRFSAFQMSDVFVFNNLPEPAVETVPMEVTPPPSPQMPAMMGEFASHFGGMSGASMRQLGGEHSGTLIYFDDFL